jgi:hypothetical protein
MTQTRIPGSTLGEPIELGSRGPLGRALGRLSAVLVALAAWGSGRAES